jgi:hypothetical protein
MKYIIFLFLPLLAIGQKIIPNSPLSDYLKTVPAYKKSTEQSFYMLGDSLKLMRTETETWGTYEHVLTRKTSIGGDCLWESHTLYFPLNQWTVGSKTLQCGKIIENLTEIHSADSIIVMDEKMNVLSITLKDSLKHTSTKTFFQNQVPGKMITTEEPGKKKEEEFLGDLRQHTRIYYGVENRYDSVVEYTDQQMVFLKTVYSYNEEGDISKEEGFRPGDGFSASYRTTYTYKYDSVKNWIEKTVHRTQEEANQTSLSRKKANETVWVFKRRLEY